MKIRYMFHSIKDDELLFDREKREELRSKEYGQHVLNDISKEIRGMTDIKYLGSLERIAREVFEIEINQETYKAVFIVDQLVDNYIRLQVEIDTEDTDGEVEDRYNKTLEYLKIAIKNRLLQDWKTCIWMYDEQSELLCSDLYSQIFRIENRVREFANRMFVTHLGTNWIDLPGLEKYKNSAQNMSTVFVSSVPDFRDINTTMLSVTLETLAEIMFKGMVYEAEYKFTRDEIVALEKIIKSNKVEDARKYIEKRRNVISNIWEDIVSVYLDNPEQFKSLFSRFIKDRNHVAHNKLLTFSSYKTMIKDLMDFDESVKNALAAFEDKNPSVEMLETLQIENEQEEYKQEYDESYWRDRITQETGVEIRTEYEIFELFIETITSVQGDIEDWYHLDECFDYLGEDVPEGSGSVLICSIQSNAVEDETLKIYAEISINDDMDEYSILEFKAVHNDETIASADCYYHNGSGSEGDNGVCVADSDSEYDTSKLESFKEEVFGFVEDDLNPFVKLVPEMDYQNMVNGEESVVADFPCEWCGKYGVSITEELFQVGKCCYCGYENEVSDIDLQEVE